MVEYDAVVVGGGIVGSATAYHLARAGVETGLYDRRDPGQATQAGAGIVSEPTVDTPGPEDWFDIAVEALTGYPDLVDAIEADGVTDHGYAEATLLSVATEDERERFEEARARTERRTGRFGYPRAEDVAEIEPADARELFPPLGGCDRVLRYDGAASVDGRRFAAALRRAGESHGLVVVEADVTEIRVAGGSVRGVRTAAGSVDADHVVIAGGAWSDAFGAQLGFDLPVEPLQGQLMHLDVPEASAAAWPIVGGFRHHYVAPWGEGRVVVGATRDADAGFAAEPTLGGLDEITSEAMRLAPGLADATHRETRVGLRPITIDGKPAIGPVPGVDGAYVATGHGPIGLQLGPHGGRVIAELIAGERASADEALALDRFL
ncbi:NAD(P)/FAD-dependent oxidoreductase [Haloferacaceae archaeon DSL9]